MAVPPLDSHRRTPLRAATLAGILAALVVALALAASAPAEDLQEKLDEKTAALDSAKDKQGVLTSEISSLNDRIAVLTEQVAALRNREAAVQAELDEAQAQLEEDQRNLRILRERLSRSIAELEQRLVQIYKSDDPDAVAVLLDADGFDDALGRFEYLQRLQDQNSDVVGRVRVLRDDMAETVDRVRANRDAIAAKRDELAQTRAELEARQGELDATRARSERALARVDQNVERLESGKNQIEEKIQEQLAAAAAAESGVPALPAGAIQAGSGAMIWPVNGPIVSPFGPRWGRMHEGVDIAVPAGTPIRAAQAGTVVLAAPTSGYGNYTCIDHGGGLSSCYAHQSSFAITSGSVAQGDVIGYVGCTGSCFGDHLHFEVRINSAATDPMGYL